MQALQVSVKKLAQLEFIIFLMLFIFFLIMIIIYISWVFSDFLTHEFLPKSAVDVILVPLIKNKSKNLSGITNLPTLESSKYYGNTYIWCPQFVGLKFYHSTDQCIYILKERIWLPFFLFLEISAFDWVSYSQMFCKLVQRSVSAIWRNL